MNIIITPQRSSILNPILDRRRFVSSALVAGPSALALSAAAPYASAFDRDDLDELYTAQVDRAIQLGLNYLVARQNPDGSFITGRWGRNVGVCSLAGLAMLSAGVRPGVEKRGEALHRIGRYILSAVQDSGFITVAGATSHGPMYGHGFATLFLAELYGADQRLEIRDKLKSAIDLIIRTQNVAGGWRYDPRPNDADLSVTVCQVMALRAARDAGIFVPNETIERSLDYLRRSQNPDGGYMYQLTGSESRFALTAAAVVAFYNAGIYSGKEIDQAIEFLEKHYQTSTSIQRNSYFFYAHYYSVQAFWHRGTGAWTDWYARLRGLILPLQNVEGNWFDYSGSEYGTAMACLILNMPRTVLPIFQR